MTEFTKTIGDNIQRLRIANEQTTLDLSSSIGISEEELLSLEAGTGTIDTLVLRRIAVELDVSLADLMDWGVAIPEGLSDSEREMVEWALELRKDIDLVERLSSN